MLLKEVQYFAPAVHRLLLAVERSVVIEEAVAGAIVAMELVVLAVLLELGLMHVHVGRGRPLVIVAEETQEWRLEIFGQIDRRDALLGRQRFLRRNDATAPQVGDRVEV